jgi:hypothetical protein
MTTLIRTPCSSTFDRKPAITPTQRQGNSYSCQRLNSIFMEFMREGLRPPKAASRRAKDKIEKTERIPTLVLKQNQGYYHVDFFKNRKVYFTYGLDKLRDAPSDDTPIDGPKELTLDYSNTLYRPATNDGLRIVDEDGTIIAILIPRAVSLEVLTLDAATSQAAIFRYLRDTLPNLNRGDGAHASRSSEKYVVSGVKARQGKGCSNTKLSNNAIIGVTDEAKTKKKDVLMGEDPQVDNQPNKKPKHKKKPSSADEDPVKHWVDGQCLKIWPRLALLRVARRNEQLLKRYISSEELHALHRALTAGETEVAETFYGLWCAAAMGTNFQAAMHLDLDSWFSMLVVSACLRDPLLNFKDRVAANVEYDSEVVHDFIFPTYGVAIPLRPGDHLLFNPLVIHGCSAKHEAYNQSDISLMAFYLKAACISGHNGDDIQLTDLQKDLHHVFKKYKNNHKI